MLRFDAEVGKVGKRLGRLQAAMVADLPNLPNLPNLFLTRMRPRMYTCARAAARGWLHFRLGRLGRLGRSNTRAISSLPNLCLTSVEVRNP